MTAEMVMKLNILLSLRAFCDFFFIKALLTKIELTKKLFSIDMEQGSEVYIPRDLAQDDLPWSFRYYDPIMNLAETTMSQEAK